MPKVNGITPKQKEFADGLLSGKDKGEAAIDAYDIESENKMGVGGAIATQNLKKLKVIEYVESQGYGAATRIVKLSKEAKNENVMLSANKDILDRVNIGVKQPINAFLFNFNSDKEEFK